MNILIIESKNDKIFVQALIKAMNIKNTDVENIQIDDDNFLSLNGVDPNPKKPTNLIRKLNDVKTDILKKGIEKIGILLDIDKNKLDYRLLLINTAIKQAFGESTFKEINDVNQAVSVQIDDEIIEIFCYFTNIDETGDLETVLRKIAIIEDANYADCLDSWRNCLETKKIKISDKDFDKLWINNYIRFDACSKKEKKHAKEYCSMQAFKYVMQKSDIFNLSHEVLDGMKKFLMQFKSSNK